MASAQEVRDSLDSFAESCNENAQLRIMNKDWNRTIDIHATDHDESFTILTQDGQVTVLDGKPASADMIVEGDSELLTQIFYGEVSPTEPYNDGTLTVHGAEQDVLHLDFITAILWG
jgi:putative sterol carrier protein